MQTEDIKKAKTHTRYLLKSGEQIPGVTTILSVLAKPALVPWANKLGLAGIEVGKYVDALAEVGTIAHYLILCHLKDETPDLRDYAPNLVDKAENCLLSFFEWEKAHTLRPHILERPLVSEKERFGGTPDFFGWVDNELELIDFKTGKAIYSEHIYQAAAYAALIEENEVAELVPARIRILQIGRSEDEGFSEKVITEWDKEWQIFYHALQIYRLTHNAKRTK